MEQYPTKDLTIDPQVAEEAIRRLAPGAVRKVGVDRLRTVRQILREYSSCKVDDEELYLLLDFFNWEMTGTRLHVYGLFIIEGVGVVCGVRRVVAG